MPVPEQIPYVGYIANGQTTEFPITFDLHDPEFLIVTLNKEIPLVGAYTIDMNAKKVVFTTAPNDNDQVELYRETELNRDTDYKSYDNSFRPEAVNYDLDTIVRILQEQHMIDAEIAARIKGEIEWRRTHDFNYDELAQVREKQSFDALKGYVDTLVASVNPGIFQGVIAGVVFARDGKSIQTHLDEILAELEDSRLDISKKADIVYVDNKLATKADKSEVQSLEIRKASIEYVDEVTSSISAGYEIFSTEVELLSSTPAQAKKAAKALDTKKVWLWENNAWHDSGLSELDLANKFTLNKSVIIYRNEGELLADSPEAECYAIAKDTGKMYFWDEQKWTDADFLISDLASRIYSDNDENSISVFADKNAAVVAQIAQTPNGAALDFKHFQSISNTQKGILIADTMGAIKVAINENGIISESLSSSSFELKSTTEKGIVVVDQNGTIGFVLSDGNNSSSNKSSEFINSATRKSLIQATNANHFIPTSRQKVRKKVNIFLIYGQSYSVGADAERIISNTQMFGNLTLGQSPKGVGEWNPTFDFEPLGGEVLFPLKEYEYETPTSGFLNTLKWLHNEKLGVDNDENHIFASVTCGIPATTIAMLSEHADPERYNKLRTALSGFKNACDAAGYEACVAGVLYMQGESDQANSLEYYYSALDTLFNQIDGTIKQFFPNNRDVDFFLGQMGGYFAYDQNNLAIQRATLKYCLDKDRAHLIGPYAQYPAPTSDIHLIANSYRWFGAQAAKVAHKVLNNYEHVAFRINSINHSKDEIFVGCNVPHPPLQFKNAYVKQTATMFSDKGFTITDSIGTIVGSDLNVQIIDDVVIKIKCNRELIGEVRVTLGDQAHHKGRHNIADSDPTYSILKWDNSDPDAVDNIAELKNKHYELHNFCSLDSIISTEF